MPLAHHLTNLWKISEPFAQTALVNTLLQTIVTHAIFKWRRFSKLKQRLIVAWVKSVASTENYIPSTSTSSSNSFASTISNHINNREKITNETLMNSSEIASPNNIYNKKASSNINHLSNTYKTTSIQAENLNSQKSTQIKITIPTNNNNTKVTNDDKVQETSIIYIYIYI